MFFIGRQLAVTVKNVFQQLHFRPLSDNGFNLFENFIYIACDVKYYSYICIADDIVWEDLKLIKMDALFYNFKANNLKGKEVSMSEFKGKTILVVNTASKCGLTPQFEGLESIYKKYKDKDFVILGFPCNQFANQEPGDEKSISEGCLLNYGVSFPMFSKIDVNGKEAHEIYKYLKNELKGTFGNEIKWNFTKFIIDKEGKPLKRFSPFSKPEKIEKYLSKII